MSSPPPSRSELLNRLRLHEAELRATGVRPRLRQAIEQEGLRAF